MGCSFRAPADTITLEQTSAADCIRRLYGPQSVKQMPNYSTSLETGSPIRRP